MRLEPLMSGGGQERGLRSGTVPTPLAVGLGAACEVAAREMGRDLQHVQWLERRLRRASAASCRWGCVLADAGSNSGGGH